MVASLLEDRISIKSFELENANFPREFLPVLLQNKGGRGSLGAQRITAKGLKLDIPELNLPGLEVEVAVRCTGDAHAHAFHRAEQQRGHGYTACESRSRFQTSEYRGSQPRT